MMTTMISEGTFQKRYTLIGDVSHKTRQFNKTIGIGVVRMFYYKMIYFS